LSTGGGLTDVVGVGVGHAGLSGVTGAAGATGGSRSAPRASGGGAGGADPTGGTGVTVVLLPPGTVASAEVRGGAPASRELALLDPVRTVDRVDAIVLCGGSVFGLAAVDGVVHHLAGAGRGYPTGAGPVPIVPAAAVFDLVVSGGRHPDPAAGRGAALAASESAAAGAPMIAGVGAAPVSGRIGAGAGATVGGWRGRGHAVAGGLGQASTVVGGATIAALAVVNAVGDVVGADGSVLAGSTAPPGVPPFPELPFGDPDADGEPARAVENTTLAVVVTDGRLDKVGCHLLAQSAHDGLAAALRPSHTRFDGDVCFAAATGAREEALDRLRIAATEVVAAAVRAAVAPPPAL